MTSTEKDHRVGAILPQTLFSRSAFCWAMCLLLLPRFLGAAWAQGNPPQQNPAAQVVQRALAAHGNGWSTGQVLDSVCDGTLTFWGRDGAVASFPATVSVKGSQQIQRSIRQPAGEVREGSDGNQSWHSVTGRFLAVAQGPAVRFIESQTVRSVPALFNYQALGLQLSDRGTKGQARVVEAQDSRGRKTDYYVDNGTSVVSHIEFQAGQSTDPFSKRVIPNIESYQFSDYRMIQGLLTPFKIERYFNNSKMEEMQCRSVQYNTSVQDNVFRP